MAEKQYEYEVRYLSWESWEVTENGVRLAVMCSKDNAEGWVKLWVKNGRRDDFYNMVGK